MTDCLPTGKIIVVGFMEIRKSSRGKSAWWQMLRKSIPEDAVQENEKIFETLKYWVGFQLGQSYFMGRRCLFSLGWPAF